MNEIINCKEGRFRRVPVRPIDQWVVGVDLGQTLDSTAITAIHHTRRALDTWTPTMPTEIRIGRLEQDAEEFFDVRVLERIPLNTPYPAQMQRIADIMSRAPLRGSDLVVDCTGVGAAVCDLLDDAGLKHIRVMIGSGWGAVRHRHDRWSVPKTEIISALDARLSTGELRFAAALRESEALREELRDFRRHLSDAGRASYNARQGAHDDLVLAVGIAMWWATQRVRRGDFSVGNVRGLI